MRSKRLKRQRRTVARQAGWGRTALLGLLSAAYLEYFFADVLLQIFSLRSLIVFVLPT
jgi:hypothetical protein